MDLKPLALAAAAAVVGVGGLALIKEHEGLRYRTYLDPVGIPTVCYGHTGPEVRLGQVYSQAQCDALLAKDVQTATSGISKCVRVPLAPNQRAAVTSLAFNVGVPKVCRSTLVRKLNAKDYSGAANEFPKWKYAVVNGKAVALPGLAKRRAAERALFLKP